MLLMLDAKGQNIGRPGAGSLTRSHAKMAAQMHLQQIPGSLITLFGYSGLIAYYRFSAASDHELLVLVLDDEGVCGASLTSFRPRTLGRRAVTQALWPHAWQVPFNRGFWTKMLARNANTGHDDPALTPLFDPEVPELLQIFVNPQMTGGGYGGTMISATEAYVKDRCDKGLLVRTENTPDNRALSFYDKRGFTKIGAHMSHGKPLAVFFKDHLSLGNHGAS